MRSIKSILLFLFLSFSLKAQIKKPNIVWITTEDMSYHIGAFGSTQVKTPNLDKLAAEGVKYTNMFSTAGVCAPSRAAIISGMYQTSTGSHNMRTSYGKDYEDIIKIAPYSVVLPEGVKPYPIILRENGYYTSNNSKEDYQFATPKGMWDESSKDASWQNRYDKNQPFFSIFNFTTTHESQVFSRENEPLRVKPENVIVPDFLPDSPNVRRDIARFMTNVELMDEQVGELIAELKAAGEYENTYIFFYPDHGDGLPYIKREVTHRGLKVPLIIKFPGGINAGQTDTQLISFVDLAPTLFTLANIKIPNYLQGRSFLNSKTENRKYVFGARDRMDTQYDRVRSISDGRFQYLKNYNLDKPYYQNISYRLQQKGMQEIIELKNQGKLNENQMRWFAEQKAPEEFYDTETDPNQFYNLINKPEYKDKIAIFKKELSNWQVKYGDMGAIPEKEIIAKWWNNKEKAPKTAEPIVSQSGDMLSIISATKSAIIVYKIDGESKWINYTHPVKLKKNTKITISAQRIGFEATGVVMYTVK